MHEAFVEDAEHDVDGDERGEDQNRLVRERDPSMPVVLATGYADAVDTATEYGAIPLIKPYSMARLAAVLGDQLLVRGAPSP